MVVLVQKENVLQNIVFVQKMVNHVLIYVNVLIVVIINLLWVNKYKDQLFQNKKVVNVRKTFARKVIVIVLQKVCNVIQIVNAYNVKTYQQLNLLKTKYL